MSERQQRVRAAEQEVIMAARAWWATRPYPNPKDPFEGLDTMECHLLRAVVDLRKVQP